MTNEHVHPHRGRLRTALVAVAVAGALLIPQPAQGAPSSLIVRAPGGGSGAAAEAVRAAGGKVTLDLSIVDGVAATVPASGVSWLRRQGLDISADERVHVFGEANERARPSTYRYEVGADRLQSWGIDGDPGKTVALIDTGVTTAGIADLQGRIVPVTDDVTGAVTGPQQCLDLSGEGTCEDSYGHGTFLAGLIAGSGAASGGAYRGVAPGTRIVSVKIAGADGSSDVSKVLAAIQYVVTFKDRYGIKVLNLSLGTDSKQDPRIDPLNLAVERAWDAGITAVVAAGNLGPGRGTVTKPGDDPLVITVGATDDRGTPAISDDRVPRFSGQGTPALRKPDVVAPGTLLPSIVPPGSTIDRTLVANGHPTPEGAYRRGSGTSMSTAVVSGLAALLIEAHPDWTPGQIKAALLTTAHKVSVSDPLVVGRGQVDGSAAVWVPRPPDANAGIPRSDGSGSLQDSRGTLIVTAVCRGTVQSLDPRCGQEISGDQTANGRTFDAEQFSGTSWYGTSWYGGTVLYGTSWYTSQWYGTSWYGTSWYGTSWYGAPASQGTTADGNGDLRVLGIAPPGSRTYGLYQ